MNPLTPKKLLLTKWTAVKPVAKQKHFLVSRVIQPELPTDPIELNLPLLNVPLSHSIMRPSFAVPRASFSQTASD
jgi:hypothetical protein